MPEPKKDVEGASESSAEEQVKEEVVKQEGAESTEQSTEQESQESTEQSTEQESQETGQSQPAPEAVDEYGVPYKNRAMEWQRKAAEMAENLPKLIQEQLAQARQQPQERQYTIEELESWALDHPEARPQVEAQKARIIQEQIGRDTEQRIKASESKREGEIKRQTAYQYVNKTYPEMFTKDALGNSQWNNQHPMTQQLGYIMQDKRFANDPEGLMAAADIAFARYSRMQLPQNQKKVKVLQQQVKKIQQKTLLEGAGQSGDTQRKSNFQKAKAEFVRTGSKESGSTAIREYLKEKGVID